MSTIIIFLLLGIVGILIAYAVVSTEIYTDKLDELEEEIYSTRCKATINSNKLLLIEKEVENTNLAETSYLELYNSYKRIKKVVANADTLTITKNFISRKYK